VRELSRILRQGTSRAGRSLALLSMVVVVFAWIAVVGKVMTPNRQGLLALAAVSLAGAVAAGADVVKTLKAVSRLRERGLSTDATVLDVDESFFYYTGWVTAITVCFTNPSGDVTRAKYTQYTRANALHGAETVRITYDPERPTSIAPAGGDSRPVSAVFIGLGIVSLLWISGYFAFRAFG
jgi:hypothetical protein